MSHSDQQPAAHGAQGNPKSEGQSHLSWRAGIPPADTQPGWAPPGQGEGPSARAPHACAAPLSVEMPPPSGSQFSPKRKHSR